MSENSPRWPGADGTGGLDFSPWRRTTTDEVDGETTASAASPSDADAPAEDSAADEVTPESATSPSSAALEDTVVSAPVSPASAPERAAKPVPESASSASKVDDSMFREGTGATRLTPTASERAASTAKEWAASPIPGVAPMTPAASPVPIPADAPARATDDDVAEASAPTVVPARKSRGRRTRKARLRLARLDPWSVMKTTFLFSIAFGIMLVVATFVVWSVLSGSGAIEAVNQFLNTALGDQNTQFDIGGILSLRRVLGFAAIIAAIDVVIITALATLAAFLYNLSATVMGGLEVTLAED